MSGSLTLRFAQDTPLKIDPIEVSLRFDISVGGLSDALAAAISRVVLAQIQPVLVQQEKDMAALDDRIAELTAAANRNTSAVNSAVTVINGINAEIEAAVAAALAKGATAEQLAEIVAVRDTVSTNAQSLADAVANIGGV